MFAINKKKKKTQIQKRTKILLFTLIAFLTAAVIIFGLFFTNIFPGINNQENNNLHGLAE